MVTGRIPPVCIAAVLTAFLVYTGIVPVRSSHQICSLIAPADITLVRGTVTSSPVRTSSGKSYRFTVTVNQVASSDVFGGSFVSDASGTADLYADASLVEALYPGRLFSRLADRESQLIEEGACITAVVRSFSVAADHGKCTVAYAANTVMVTGFTGLISRIRALARLQLKRILYTWGDAGGLLLALLSGEREYTGADLAEAFRKAGLSHILALSGMHLSLFAGMAEKLTVRRFGVRGSVLWGLFAAVVFVWFAGSTPSLIRALLCMGIGFISASLSVTGSGIQVLSLAFLLQVALFPSQVHQVAFMLSYAALSGVFLGSRYITPFLRTVLPESVASSAGASMGSFICTCAISIGVFGSSMPFGIVSSVVVTPLAQVFVTAGIASVVLSLAVPFLLLPVGGILSIIYRVLQLLVQAFARLPGITVSEDI